MLPKSPPKRPNGALPSQALETHEKARGPCLEACVLVNYVSNLTVDIEWQSAQFRTRADEVHELAEIQKTRWAGIAFKACVTSEKTLLGIQKVCSQLFVSFIILAQAIPLELYALFYACDIQPSV